MTLSPFDVGLLCALSTWLAACLFNALVRCDSYDPDRWFWLTAAAAGCTLALVAKFIQALLT